MSETILNQETVAVEATPIEQLVKVQIIGAENSKTIRIQSRVTPKQIQLVAVANPALLTLTDADKKPLFLLSVGGTASANIKGVVIPGAKTTNFTVDVAAHPELFNYTVSAILSNLTKVLSKVEELATEINESVVEVI